MGTDQPKHHAPGHVLPLGAELTCRETSEETDLLSVCPSDSCMDLPTPRPLPEADCSSGAEPGTGW